MWGRLFRFFLVILLAPMIAAVTYEAVRYLVAILTLRGVMWFALGAFGLVSFYLLFLRGSINFLESLFHEMRHAIMSWILAGRLPDTMVIQTAGNSAVQGGVNLSCFTVLAPYLFPMLVLPFLGIKVVYWVVVRFAGVGLPGAVGVGLDFLIGVTWGLHFVLLFRDFHFGQSDFKRMGWVFSTVMIVFLNFFFLVVVLTVVTNSYPEFWEFLKACWDTTKEFYRVAWTFLTDTAIPGLKRLWQRIFLMLCQECPRPTPTPGPGGK